jgi:hypothetical protein
MAHSILTEVFAVTTTTHTTAVVQLPRLGAEGGAFHWRSASETLLLTSLSSRDRDECGQKLEPEPRTRTIRGIAWGLTGGLHFRSAAQRHAMIGFFLTSQLRVKAGLGGRGRSSEGSLLLSESHTQARARAPRQFLTQTQHPVCLSSPSPLIAPSYHARCNLPPSHSRRRSIMRRPPAKERGRAGELDRLNLKLVASGAIPTSLVYPSVSFASLPPVE